MLSMRCSSTVMAWRNFERCTYQEIRSEGVTESELTDELAQRIVSYGPLFDGVVSDHAGIYARFELAVRD